MFKNKNFHLYLVITNKNFLLIYELNINLCKVYSLSKLCSVRVLK